MPVTRRQIAIFEIWRLMRALRIGFLYGLLAFILALALAAFAFADGWSWSVTRSWIWSWVHLNWMHDPAHPVILTDPGGAQHALTSVEVLNHKAVRQITYSTLTDLRNWAIGALLISLVPAVFGFVSVRRETGS